MCREAPLRHAGGMEEKSGEDLMPKGRVENLLKREDRTPDERREIARKAGRASGKARREKRRLQDIVRVMLDADSKDDPDMTVGEALVASMIENAMAGDVKAFVALRDTAGYKPTEKQQTELSGSLSLGWMSPGSEPKED